MTGIVVAFLIVASCLVTIWALARKEILWCYIKANTFALVVTGENDPSDTSISSGGVVDVLHEIPGKRLDKSSLNKFEWKFVDGEENRDLLHFLLGVQWIGVARSLRINRMKGSDSASKYVYCSREQDVEVVGAKTMGVYRLNFRFNLLYNVVFPLRAVLGVANPNTVLSYMVDEVVANVSGTREPEYFLQGNSEHKREVVEAVKGINDEMLNKIGTSLHGVNLLPITLDEESRKLFELNETTRRENEAALQVAEMKKKVGIMENDVRADHVERVLIPTGAAVGGPAVRIAEAVEKTNLGTLALGAIPAVLPIISSDK